MTRYIEKKFCFFYRWVFVQNSKTSKINRKLSQIIIEYNNKKYTINHIRLVPLRRFSPASVIVTSNDIPSPRGDDDIKGENNTKYHCLPKAVAKFDSKSF